MVTTIILYLIAFLLVLIGLLFDVSFMPKAPTINSFANGIYTLKIYNSRGDIGIPNKKWKKIYDPYAAFFKLLLMI
jgi:hypothetical protein